MDMKIDPQDIKCGECSLRLSAEANPKSFKARLWRWHTSWCPGWKAYQQYLADHPELEQPKPTR